MTDSKDIIAQTLQELMPETWETALSDVKDNSTIEKVLVNLMRQCMSKDDYTLFKLSISAINGWINEDIAEAKFEKYLDTHDLDESLEYHDILCDGIPVSQFQIDFNKFINLTHEKYGWVYEYSSQKIECSALIVPENPSIDCDAYITGIAFEINLLWMSIKSKIYIRYRESVKAEALSIIQRNWEDISAADYDRAIGMLRTIDAYPELINILREWIFIKGENGWKVKRSDTIEALRLEEEATLKGENVTLQDWADLYTYDTNSAINQDNTKIGILETLCKEGSGLAALILGDICFESSLWFIKLDNLNNRAFTKESRDLMEVGICDELKLAIDYYKTAAGRGYAMGYMAQSLIYRIFGQVDIAKEHEQNYKNAPYTDKRASYNLSRNYKKTDEYKKRTELINNNFKDDEGDACYNWLTPLPLSLLALDKAKALKYVDRIFSGIKL